jgi:PiT family inorganic phosphate transporter
MTKSAIDKDLKRIVRLEDAVGNLSRSLAAPGLAALFLLAVVVFAYFAVADVPMRIFVIAAGVIGGYMALNIGANDVANNVGPAVGGRAMSMTTALIIAAICESSGALLAGGDVVSTIAKGIIVPPETLQGRPFVFLMMSALLSAAIWIHLATILRAPVSTTHSIVGGVLGAGLAAAGPAIVQWGTMTAIAASWVISPLMGGLIAAAFLAFIKWAILYREDRISAARKWVPFLIGIMVGVFTAYMSMKGLKRIWKPTTDVVVMLSIASFVIGWIVAVPWIKSQAEGMSNGRKQVGKLFNIPLIMGAALLSFAHGANDVANAVGPLAAIVAATSDMGVSAKVGIPLWVLAIGAVGITIGLALFGPRLIKTVGEKVTKMNTIRAFCVALSAGITVLIASAFGLPVSSTHIAIGGVFGVGFLREYWEHRDIGRGNMAPKPVREEVEQAPLSQKKLKKENKKTEKRRLVRRRHVLGIGAAWVITVPAAGSLAAGIYLILSGLFIG